MSLQASRDLTAAQAQRLLLLLGLTRQGWAGMGPDFDASWVTVGPRLVVLTSAAQLGAARDGASSVPAALAEQGVDVAPLGEVAPAAFVGVASDGRPLDSLLYGAVTTAKTQVGLGALPGQALTIGGRWLDMAVHTQVADAGRSAAGVAITARPKVGWVRMVNPPCCSRCAVLAGKWFKWNQGFRRHPRCDCTHVASTESASAGLTTEPPLDQVTGLSKPERAALTEGADMGQVVNVRRGSKGMTTTEGTTRRGIAGSRLQGRQRLTPVGIYRLASTRDEAVRLLTAHGYLL